jgi:hypothetical protein
MALAATRVSLRRLQPSTRGKIIYLSIYVV